MNNAIKSASRSKLLLRIAAAGLVALAGSQAQAAAITLCAQPFTKIVASGVNVPMWGYSAGACGNPSAPGPMVTVPAGDTTLQVTLINNLTVPTSIVLSAQALPTAIDGVAGSPTTSPVMAADVVGPTCTPDAAALTTDANHPLNCRVRSFTGETAPGTTRVYEFTNLRPGTYLYQSGTHPQVQVQMGLAGMARIYPNTALGVTSDVPVVLTEIDVAMHQRIASTLGSANPASWKAGGNSTFNYAPGYFLVNGRVFGGINATTGIAATDIDAPAVRNQSVRLRIANAGLQSRSLVLNRGMWSLVGEDGYAYPAAREQATLLLPAGKTTDADILITDPVPGSRLALFDRRDGAENPGDTTLAGGQIARIVTSVAGTAPFLEPINDQLASEAVPFSLQAVATNAVSFTLTGALPGMTINDAGLLSWPSPAGAGGDVTVNAWSAAGGTGTRMSRTFNVKVINHKPVMTTPPAYTVVNGTLNVAAPGLLAFATDADGDAMTAVQLGTPLTGLSLASNGGFNFSVPRPAADVTQTFQAAALDATGLQSAPVTVTLNLKANVAPVAINDGTPTVAIQTIVVARSSAGATTGSISLTPLANRQFAPTVLTVNDTDAETSVVANSLLVSSWPRTSAPVGVTVTATRVSNTGAELALPFNTTTQQYTQNEAAVVFSGGALTFTPRTTVASGGTVVPANGLGVYKIRYTVQDTDGGTSNVGTAYILVQLAP